MYTHKSILLFGENDGQFFSLQTFCRENEIKFQHTCKLSELITTVNETRYNALIIDEKSFPLTTDLLSIFSNHRFFVPNVFVLTDKMLNGNCKACKSIGEVIRNLENYFEEMESVQPYIVDVDLYTKVTDIINHLGFNSKYKGYKYLIDILTRMLINNLTSVSFRKHIYPFISTLYSVSEDSIERDLRNILLKAINKNQFKETICFNEQTLNQTTRNIINCLLIYIKKNLHTNKYSKLSY